MKRRVLVILLAFAVLHATGSSAIDVLSGQKTNDRRIGSKAFVLSEGRAGSDTAQAASTRLQPADFIYQGAFRLPDDFNWGAQGLSYYPLGDAGKGSLLVTGHDQVPVEFAEVSIPSPAISANWLSLPIAIRLRPFVEFDGDLIESYFDPWDTIWAGDIEYVPRRGAQTSDKIYGSLDHWYWVSDPSFPVVWFSEMDGSSPRGLFHVGPWEQPYHGNKQGDYLFTVPQWYADRYLGGRTLVTGKCRGTEFGSMGPALFTFRPWATESPSGDLDAVPMLWYRFQPLCAAPNVTDKTRCDFPDFTMCDDWRGASFVEAGSKQAIILLGVKGLGDNNYGTLPGGCRGDEQGYHCDPLERQVIFYDVDELGLVAQGVRNAWNVVPYAIWRPTQFYLRDAQGHTCGDVGGMAFDSATQRVFMIERGLGSLDDNSAVVHVWTVAGGTPIPAQKSHLEFLPLLLLITGPGLLCRRLIGRLLSASKRRRAR
ncbi:MAG: hypothetical protein RBS57_14960 [Desulforhabdus sp.]|jgi:hypothetical protein|nr:hypothetical protein [Desulforhabdus sp.]